MFNSDFMVESIVDAVNITLWAIGAITVTVGAVKGVVKIARNISAKVKEYDSKAQQDTTEATILDQLMSDPSLLAAVQQIIADKQDNVVHVVDAEGETA